jgi:hypothetical protein
MLYASAILFEPHMSVEQLDHWLLFFRALHISYGRHTSNSVSMVKGMHCCLPAPVLTPLDLLRRFYKGLPKFYGLDICDPVVHCVGAHAWKDLQDLGPLSDRSAAPFEVLLSC